VMIDNFPGVYFETYILTPADNVSTISAALDAFIAAAAPQPVTEVVLMMYSQQMVDYGLQVAAQSKYAGITFINTTSTADDVRTPAPSNVYFTAETNSTFLPSLFARYRGPTSIQFLVVQNDVDVFHQQVVDAATAAGLTAYTLSQLSDPAVQAALATATAIFISSFAEDQQSIVDNLPLAFVNNVVFVDSGPVTQAVVDAVRRCRVIGTDVPPTTLSPLTQTSRWAVDTKRSFDSSSPPLALSLYTLFSYLTHWTELLVTPGLVQRTPFDVPSVFFFSSTPS
jgi:hypothetical protein